MSGCASWLKKKCVISVVVLKECKTQGIKENKYDVVLRMFYLNSEMKSGLFSRLISAA